MTDDVAREAAQAKEENFLNHFKETVILFAVAFLLAFLFKTLLFQPFKVDMSSMSPTILSGERIIVSKISYRLDQPKPGDVVTFYSPEKEVPGKLLGLIPVKQKKILIKRIIATEGQRVELKNGELFIDGKSRKELFLGQKDTTSTLHETIVPRDEVFVMGDNRLNSKDSRVLGTIPDGDIIGKAIFIYWPLESYRIM